MSRMKATQAPELGKRRRKRIGELLVEDGVVTPDQIDEALAVQKDRGGKLVEALINLGYLTPDAFANFVSHRRGIPSIDLSQYDVPEELCSLIPREFALANEVFPIDRLGKLLTVGMAMPLDVETIEELAVATGLKVKALLCSKIDISNAIKKYYGEAKESGEISLVVDEPSEQEEKERIESSIKLESLAGLVRKLDSLPTLPQTVQRVREATESDSISLREVGAIVSTDPAVSAKLLRMANSAAFGFPNRINTVEMATTLLGLRETYSVVLSSSIIDLVEKSGHFDHRKFWDESIYCATVARLIAKAKRVKKTAGIFTAALLHDIGRFAIWEAAPARYAKVNIQLMGKDLIETEEAILGITHPEAGYVLAEHWDLPADLSQPIRFHHHPERADTEEDIVAIVALSAAMTEARSGGLATEEALFGHAASYAKPLEMGSSHVFQIHAEALDALANQQL